MQTYPLLVPSAAVPLWKPRPISSVARHAHLYTSALGGSASDDFERWISVDVEQPAIEAIERVRAERRMRRHDWSCLAKYVAALDQRTPAAYLESMRHYREYVPVRLQEAQANLRARIAAGENIRLPELGAAPQRLRKGEFPLKVWAERDVESGQAILHLEVVAGRELWLQDIRRLITSTSHVLEQHRWIILNPPSGVEWITSDHPVIRLNYYGPGDYDFRGGWGKKGTEIILPLSPQHLLYTKVGERRLRHAEASPELALNIRRFTVESAHRWIYARRESQDVLTLRPRQVSRERYAAERREWDTWHAVQSEGIA